MQCPDRSSLRVTLVAAILLCCASALLCASPVAGAVASRSTLEWFPSTGCANSPAAVHRAVVDGLCYSSYADSTSFLVTCTPPDDDDDDDDDKPNADADWENAIANFQVFQSPDCAPGTQAASGAGRADGESCLAALSSAGDRVIGYARLRCSVACTGRLLVAMSSANSLPLSGPNGSVVPHATGFSLAETFYPLRALVSDRDVPDAPAGFDVQFANPLGNRPPMDELSNQAKYFGGDDARRQEALDFVAGLANFKAPYTFQWLAEDAQADLLASYDALLIPGGHAAMADLPTDPDLGAIILRFQASQRPIAAISHGPLALLASQNPRAGTPAPASAAGWPFINSTLTVYPNEGDIANAAAWGGDLPFLPQSRLRSVGVQVMSSARAPLTNPLVVVSANLVTAQNAMSAFPFGSSVAAQMQSFCGDLPPADSGGDDRPHGNDPRAWTVQTKVLMASTIIMVIIAAVIGGRYAWKKYKEQRRNSNNKRQMQRMGLGTNTEMLMRS